VDCTSKRTTRRRSTRQRRVNDGNSPAFCHHLHRPITFFFMGTRHLAQRSEGRAPFFQTKYVAMLQSDRLRHCSDCYAHSASAAIHYFHGLHKPNSSSSSGTLDRSHASAFTRECWLPPDLHGFWRFRPGPLPQRVRDPVEAACDLGSPERTDGVPVASNGRHTLDTRCLQC
jgi:hypothetical protein